MGFNEGTTTRIRKRRLRRALHDLSQVWRGYKNLVYKCDGSPESTLCLFVRLRSTKDWRSAMALALDTQRWNVVVSSRHSSPSTGQRARFLSA